MKYFIRFFIPVLSLLFIVFLFPHPVNAMDFRSSEKSVVVAEDELIVGTLVAAGNTVDINGSVDGDVLCIGQTITIHGSVSGDIICAGQTIRIDGTVGGNVRVAGQTVDVESPVARNGILFGQTVTLGKESVVSGDVITAGQTVSVLGDIGKGVLGAGNDISIDGTIDGDARVFANAITVGQSALITGTLNYESDANAVIAEGAQVGNTVKQPMRKEFQEMKKANQPKDENRGKKWPMNALGSMLTYIIFGCIGVLLFKEKMRMVIETMKEHTLGSVGYGLLWIMIFPALFITLFVTIIGIPVAILYAMVFAFVLWIAKLFTAMYIGKEVVQSFWKAKEMNWYLVIIIGVILTELIFFLPFVGGLTACLAMLWGTGGLIKTYFHSRTGKKAVK
jgi:cytoskeletal protein CcmA (bactofilin family)